MPMLADVPGHVPPELVHDIDLYAPPGMNNGVTEDVHALWKAVQNELPPVFWTPHYGGHWIATRYAEIDYLLKEWRLFSSRETFVPKDVIPKLLPVCLDPPDHAAFRKLLMPAFTPAMLQKATDRARAVASELIDQLQPRGQCEFVADFAGTMPIAVFQALMNLPREDYAYVRSLAINMSSPVNPKSPAAWAEFSDYVRLQITKRRHQPQADLISSLLEARVDGRALSDDETFSLCLIVVAGGVNTVISLTGFLAWHLATSPAHRRELIDHPQRIGDAIEEMTRRYGISNLGRTVVEDTTLGGAPLRAGEMVIAMMPLAGLDERRNPDPLAVDFARKGRRHLAYGAGIHTCIGNNLARKELRVFVEEWLARIPDFHLTPGKPPVMTTGIVNAVQELHLSWAV